MYGRHLANAEARRLYVADRPCILHVWAYRRVSLDTESAPAYVAPTKDDCRYDRGTPIPEARVPIELRAGEEVWAISEDQTLIGWSVETI